MNKKLIAELVMGIVLSIGAWFFWDHVYAERAKMTPEQKRQLDQEIATMLNSMG